MKPSNISKTSRNACSKSSANLRGPRVSVPVRKDPAATSNEADRGSPDPQHVQQLGRVQANRKLTPATPPAKSNSPPPQNHPPQLPHAVYLARSAPPWRRSPSAPKCFFSHQHSNRIP